MFTIAIARVMVRSLERSNDARALQPTHIIPPPPA